MDEHREETTAENNGEPKKISLAEAVKRKLEEKKQAAHQEKGQKTYDNGKDRKIKSQTNRQSKGLRRKMGG